MKHPAPHIIDADGKSLGRVASEAAKTLMGKMSPSYTPNILSCVGVSIINVGKINMRERKRTQKIYTRYSGFPGGLKKESVAMLDARKSSTAVMRRAIERMLPRNRMRTDRMKHLTISA